MPDETTILNFRHLLERHELGKGLLDEINAHLESQGLRLREGTIVDASIMANMGGTPWAGWHHPKAARVGRGGSGGKPIPKFARAGASCELTLVAPDSSPAGSRMTRFR